MNKILSITQAITYSKKLHAQNKRIVLVGGCFDILHLGHVIFLQKAKAKGDILFVWIESDQTIKHHKGNSRPIHTQKDRAYVISALACVDTVVLLPCFSSDSEYDSLVKKLKPAIIAATKGDADIMHKKRAAKTVGAVMVYVTGRIPQQSTSRLAELVARE